MPVHESADLHHAAADEYGHEIADHFAHFRRLRVQAHAQLRAPGDRTVGSCTREL